MRGRVVETAGNTVPAGPENGSARGCESCAAPCAFSGEQVLVRAEKSPGPGQIVEFRRGGLVLEAAAVLLPPAAAYVLGYVLGARAFPAGEAARAWAGLAAMFLAALSVCFFRRRRARASPRV
jgi:hypothetical protein